MKVPGTPVLFMHTEGDGGEGGVGVGIGGSGGDGGGVGVGVGVGDDGEEPRVRTPLYFLYICRETATVAWFVGTTSYCVTVSCPKVSSICAIHLVKLLRTLLLYRFLGKAVVEAFVFRYVAPRTS